MVLEGLLLAAAAVIVTYNSEGFVQQCIEALAEMAPCVQPIVVDNASRDSTLVSLGRLPAIQVIANSENRGFAAAVNQGVLATDAEYILLLNPDVKVRTGVDALLQAAECHGLAAGKLVDERARAQKGFNIRSFPGPATLGFELGGINRLWPSNPINRKYRCLDRDSDEPGPVDQPAGAFLMFRRDVWERLGGFDESFFPIWFEDVDFCRRAVTAGYQIDYVPSVVAQHRGGHSVQGLPPACRALVWCDSLLKYAAKHFRSLEYRAVCLAVVLTSVPRMVAGMIQERTLSSAAAYFRIFRGAGRCLLSRRQSSAGASSFINK